MGCSNSPIIVQEEKAVLPGDNLLADPCKAIEAGDTVRTLAKGYIHNTDCVYKFATKLEDLRTWKLEQERVYQNNNN